MRHKFFHLETSLRPRSPSPRPHTHHKKLSVWLTHVAMEGNRRNVRDAAGCLGTLTSSFWKGQNTFQRRSNITMYYLMLHYSLVFFSFKKCSQLEKPLDNIFQRLNRMVLSFTLWFLCYIIEFILIYCIISTCCTISQMFTYCTISDTWIQVIHVEFSLQSL